NNPNAITPELNAKIYRASADDLVFSKIAVQYFDIPPEKLIDIVYREHINWYKIVDKDTMKAEDKSFDVFVGIKNTLEENIKSYIKKYTDNKEIDKINFDEEKPETIKELSKDIPSEDLRDRIDRMIDQYYTINPEKLAYVKHLVLSSPDNLKIFSSHIRDFIEGRTPRGKEVADPFMREFYGRKIPTLVDLVEAGYKIERNHIKILAATMKYYYYKKVNQQIAELFKTKFLEDFRMAYETAKLKRDPRIIIEFLKETSGYFYIPPPSDLKAISEKINLIEKQLETIDPASSKYIELQRQQADLKDRLNLMKTLRKTLAGIKGKDEEFIPNKDDIANALIKADTFIPANRSSFVNDSMKGLELIKAAIHTKIGKMRAADLTNYDGIYFSRVLWKGMRQFVFRNDYMDKNYEYAWQRKVWKIYDTLNKYLKMMRFYKPTIIMANDLIQAAIANPAFIKNIPFAFRAVLHNNERDESGNLLRHSWFYQKMAEMNLFNRAVGMPPLLTETSKAVAEIMGRAGVWGEIADKISGQSNYIKKIAQGFYQFWRVQQSVTWGIDEIIRTAVAKTMFDRFSKVYDTDRAAFLAAEWTNLFLVKYSRIPTSTRQILNRIGFVLTYRIQTLRMYKEMLKMFGRGTGRFLEKDEPETMYKLYEDKFRQSLFEMGPFLRALIMKGTIKALLFSLFGFGYDNILDAITSYRAKKYKKGKTILDDELQFLSLATPLFDIEKYITRPLRVTLKYNIAAFPGLIWSLATNSHLVTGKRIITADWAK
ncbi:MAG: hypothetical protein ACTSQG_11075, partial [Promethearchaeota archaeon]